MRYHTPPCRMAGDTAHRAASRGFTLIELVIVMAVAAILAAVAYPSYQDAVSKARRSDGMLVLTEATQFMERYAALNLRYDQNAAGTAVELPSNLQYAPKEGTTKYYEITVTADEETFTLEAKPIGPQSGDRCGTLKIDQRGVRTAADFNCWLK